MRLPIAPTPAAALARLLPPRMLAGADTVVDTLLASTTVIADGSTAIGATADELAGSLFGASLFPWLAMLYWLKHPTVAAPPGVSFGLTFLLAFVFGSIPAAIGAGALYGVSLADADWLHGAAESLLAITNCVVVLGFRDALDAAAGGGSAAPPEATQLRTAATALGALAAASAVAVFASGGAEVHTPWLGGVGALPLWAAEPANALSVPTWIIHTSSLVEWLVAMGLAWKFAEATGQPRWKGVTWGMLPLHTSGIVACTYHLFYNAPALSWCVALQAGMTCVGNTTLAIACLRLALASGWTWQMGADDAAAAWASVVAQVRGEDDPAAAEGGATRAAAPSDAVPSDAATAAAAAPSASPAAALVGWEDLGDAWASDGNAAFLGKLLALSGALAYGAKYLPALASGVEVPEGVLDAAAGAVIVVPTALNCAKWLQRSKEGAEFVGDI